MSVLQVLAAVLVLFFLPGYTFINMLFPRRGELDLEYDQLYRIGLGMGMSIALSILTGYILGYYGLFYSMYLWLTLINLTVIFFIIGFLRGAYPSLRKYLGYGRENKYDSIYMLQDLLHERKKLIKKIEEANRLSKVSPRHEFYERERDKLLKEIEELDKKIDSLKEVLNEK